MQLTKIFHLKKLALALTATLAATLPSAARDFTYTYEGQTITYTVTNEDAKTCITKRGDHSSPITGGNIITGDLILPAHPMDGDTEFTLTRIGNYSFYQNTGLTSVTLPETITQIDINGFYGCTSLSSVTLNEGLTAIQSSALRQCTSLTSISIPASVSEIGRYAFGGDTKLTYTEFASIESYLSIEFGELGNPVRQSRKLYVNGEEVTDIVIPDNITRIGDYQFEYFSGLKSITIPNTVTYIGINAFYGCIGLTKLELPSSVQIIKEGAFNNCTKITSCIIPESVTAIENNTFNYCTALTTVQLPKNLTSIGNGAFAQCTSLKPLIIPAKVTSIGTGAFTNCSKLTKAAYPSTLETNPFPTNTSACTYPPESYEMVDGVIYGNDRTQLCYVPIEATSFEIPSTVETIGEYALARCAITEISIPSSVKTINKNAFYSCTKLTKSNFESIEQMCAISYNTNYSNPTTQSKNLYIGGEAVTDLVIPSTVSSINKFAFYSCEALKSVTIPSSVKTIGQSAFRYCNGLTTAVIPPTVTTIGATVFADCAGLVKSAYPEDSANNPFSNGTTTYGAVITYPRDAQFVDDVIYSADGSQLDYVPIDVTEFEMPEDVQTVGTNAFAACYNVATLRVTPEIPAATDASFDPTMFDQTLLQVPDTKESDYRAADGWKSFKQIETYHIPAPAIAVEPTELELTEGDSEKVQATLTDLPEDTAIVWTSSDEEVATVDADGTITAVAPGIATITATAAEVSATVEVTVNRQLHPAIVIDAEDLEMTVGDSKQLSITRTDLSDEELVTWVSSDPDVASVDDEGLLTAIEAGTATITAYCGTAEASIKVTVKAKGGTTLITNVKAAAPDEDLYDLRGIKVVTPTRSQIYIRRKK